MNHTPFGVPLWLFVLFLPTIVQVHAWARTSTVRLPPHKGYHGALAQPHQPFLEGWYLRLVLPCDDGNGKGNSTSFAFIYHVLDPHFDSRRTGVGLQVLVPQGTVAVARADMRRFRAAAHALAVQNTFRGGSFFVLTERHAQGTVYDSDAAVTFDFDLRPVLGWGGTLDRDRQYATAGFWAAFPMFEPHYQVLISQGWATGSIVVAETTDNTTIRETRCYNFTDATVYLEKNWGSSFPSIWYWIQANTCFVRNKDQHDTVKVCITSTAAKRKLPLTQQQDVAGLIGIHYNNEFLAFSNVEWDIQWGSWNIRGWEDDYTVQLTGTCRSNDVGFPVRCPTETGMQEIAQETFHGTLCIELYQAGNLVLNATTHQACLEIGGSSRDKPFDWRGRSEIAEPYRSIVMNRRLERFGANVLDAINQVWRIPGL